MARYKCKVATNGTNLNVRSGAGTSYKIVGKLANGTEKWYDQIQSGWYRIEGTSQWCSGTYLKVLQSDTGAVAQPPTPPQPTSVSLGFDSTIYNMLYQNIEKKRDALDVSTRLFGCPHQFLKTADVQINSKVVPGRTYMTNYLVEAPVVYFLPGRPNYLPKIAKAERDSLSSFFNNKQKTTEDNSALQKIIGDTTDIRYYDFMPDYTSYMKYVNLLCRSCAIFLGIDTMKGPTGTRNLRTYDWGSYKYSTTGSKESKDPDTFFNLKEKSETMVETLFGNDRYIQFYVDPSSSFNESFSNSTTQSMIASAVDNVEQMSKDLSFFLNTGSMSNADTLKNKMSQGINDVVDGASKLFGNEDNVLSRIFSVTNQVIQGSNMIFPEIWNDSDYSKSYTITLNLTSPYGDREAIYLNIFVPMFHAMALMLPRQTSANSYASPFLVKVFSHGWFSCEMGIVDSLQIEKDGWTAEGLPSSVKITMTVRDMYSALSMSPTTQPSLFYSNQSMIDFLAATCGVRMDKANVQLRLEVMSKILLGSGFDMLNTDIWVREFYEKIQNTVLPLFKL